ncbi:unnamed protein product [Mesocestoides corti]|uniref:SH3 domain-containing protein n=1 Tax=Mesocestoides corti TaxID=53468 RepID=A0A0R3UML8_MESCO|nr:unnamed protein product [Mesocestoides corti]
MLSFCSLHFLTESFLVVVLVEILFFCIQTFFLLYWRTQLGFLFKRFYTYIRYLQLSGDPYTYQLSMSTVKETDIVVAKFDYKATDNQELDIHKGEKLTLMDDTQHWWKVMNSFGQVGYVPSNYVKRSKQVCHTTLFSYCLPSKYGPMA